MAIVYKEKNNDKKRVLNISGMQDQKYDLDHIEDLKDRNSDIAISLRLTKEDETDIPEDGNISMNKEKKVVSLRDGILNAITK